tara:strand:- start:257 stop:742 length:486 start_codon:yes stop_codon:yes gene_type:complete
MNKTVEDIEKQDDLTTAERTLNSGIEVELKSLGVVRVREVSFEKLILFGRDAQSVLERLNLSESDMAGAGWILKILADADAQLALRGIMESSTGCDADSFKDMGIKDWLVIVAAMKMVHDWEEIQALFFQLVPQVPQVPVEPASSTATKIPVKRGRKKKVQ